MDGDIRPLDPADPRQVAGHTLLGRLGSGGMGTVYLGADPVSGGRVAVKTIHPHLAGDPVYRRRFKDEAYLASRVASFCTARVLAHGEENGRPYLVTDYVGGISLHNRLVAEGPLPPADLHGVAVGVASALAAIHAAGLVHRDLKPANVMLTLSGCRVIDFGIASGQDDASGADASGKVLGTPGWMAPEVLVGGPATPAADIFAWGCLIAHAGTGQMPIGGDPATLRTGDPDLSRLPEPLVPAVRSALAPDPAARPSACDLLLALVEQPQSRPHVGGWPEADPAPRPQRPPAPPSGRPGWEETETKAFTPPGMGGAGGVRGMGGALPFTRTRLLASVGAAAGTVLIGAIIAGLTQGRSDAPPAPSTTVPSSPTASATPPKRATIVKPGPAKRPVVKTPKQKHKPKHKQKHGKQKGKHKRG
ncbi:serine/threonine-protein kinase [Actinomadura latina]|uniref:Serine/threonine protein kinase n=1 Tax=Actinomadura latina TaxID=163603 RepID=A0A846YYH2_9ACTN|nr:serine/threonine-protein kinase [Actinomadura latina]NKZ03634.1 serine/threonine protein kinase [Actinomadura latina]